LSLEGFSQSSGSIVSALTKEVDKHCHSLVFSGLTFCISRQPTPASLALAGRLQALGGSYAGDEF